MNLSPRVFMAKVAIDLDPFPQVLLSEDKHEELEQILKPLIPEMTSDGLQGGIWHQTKSLFIEVDLNDSEFPQVDLLSIGGIFKREVETFLS